MIKFLTCCPPHYKENHKIFFQNHLFCGMVEISCHKKFFKRCFTCLCPLLNSPTPYISCFADTLQLCNEDQIFNILPAALQRKPQTIFFQNHLFCVMVEISSQKVFQTLFYLLMSTFDLSHPLESSLRHVNQFSRRFNEYLAEALQL